MSENKKAVITGGASGLGKAAALKLSQEGYDVVVIDRLKDGPFKDGYICCDISDASAA